MSKLYVSYTDDQKKTCEGSEYLRRASASLRTGLLNRAEAGALQSVVKAGRREPVNRRFQTVARAILTVTCMHYNIQGYGIAVVIFLEKSRAMEMPWSIFGLVGLDFTKVVRCSNRLE